MNTAVATAASTEFNSFNHHLESVGGAASAHSASGAMPHTAAAGTKALPPLETPALGTAAPSFTPFPGVIDDHHVVQSPITTTNTNSVPPLDQLPLEVLNLVASLVAPPFYTPPPPEGIQPTPEPYVISSLDPQPSSAKTVAAELSAITKTCSHVLEASRPWLWENLDIRSGKGWLAVVDALTEVVLDEEEEAPLSPQEGEDMSPNGSPFRAPQQAVAGPSQPSVAQASLAAHVMVKTASLIESATGSVTPPPDSPASEDGGAQPAFTTASMPVGSRGFPFQRSVTLDLSAAHRLNAERPRTTSSGYGYPPQPRRLSVLQNTPPGSRTTSPGHNPNARLRGRSRSPRRGLDFDTEGISSVLSRSLSLSLPAGYHPLMRQSSLSRVLGPSFEDSPSPEPLTPPEPAVCADENPNPEMLPPPGPYIRHLSFTNFRTIGARRSQAQAVVNRFVTAGRLEGVIKNAPNLRTIFMTEYVDSSLSYPVVEEIFFRGYPKPRVFRPRSTSFSPSTRARSVSVHPAAEPAQSTIDDQHDPPRPVYVPYEDETEDQKWHRRRMFTPIEALDLTGCVSRAFTQSAKEFGENWLDLGIDEEDDGEERGRSRRRRRAESSADEDDDEEERMAARAHHPLFPALRRLSLRGCTNLQPDFIQALVLCMPNLTHLDLSGTNANNALLRTLTYNPPRGMRLQSLSLARCPQLTPRTVVDFLVESPVARDLLELNLFVHPTQTNSIESDDLFRLLKEAPCLRSGTMRYLDLSSAGFTPEHLDPEVFPPQPSLISLGLCHVPALPLRDIASFLQNSAAGVEVLALTGTSVRDLRPDATSLQTTLTLHALLINPLTTVPFSLSSIDFSSGGRRVDLSAGSTRLRAVELAGAIRSSLAGSQGSGRTEWQVVKSKLGRGWYVDVSAGWIPSDTVDQWGFTPGGAPTAGEGRSALSFVRHLPASHPRRQYMTNLAEADGRVPTDVGWHSRKMEVVKGYGMMGREEGVGGKGAFSSNE